jgi:hypothetical protein
LFALFNGQSLGPVLWGAIAEHEGYAICFATSGCGLLLMAAVTTSAMKRAGLPRPAR